MASDQEPVNPQVTVGVPVVPGAKPTLQVATHVALTRLVAEHWKGLALAGTVVGLVAHTAAWKQQQQSE